MNAIGYIRCSTDEQTQSGLGLEAQAECIRAYCTLKGLTLVRTVQDAGVSGGKPLSTREGGQKLRPTSPQALGRTTIRFPST